MAIVRGLALAMATIASLTTGATESERSTAPSWLAGFRADKGFVVISSARGTRRVVVPPRLSVDEAQFSPDGQRLALIGLSLEAPLYVVSTSGADLRLVAQRTSSFAWAPDSQRLAYTTRCLPRRSPKCRSALYVTNARRTNARRIATAPKGGFLRTPAWGPGGARLLYVQGGGYAIYAVGADGSGRKLVARDADRNLGGASWSPGGTRIAHGSDCYDNNPGGDVFCDVVVLDPITGKHRIVAKASRGGFTSEPPVWADVDTLLLAKFGYSAALLIVDADTGSTRKLLGGWWALTVSRDGSAFAAIRSTQFQQWEFVLGSVSAGIQRRFSLPDADGLTAATWVR
jgi:Tol biopolymer transport system component